MRNLLIIDSSKWILDSLTKAINWKEINIEVIGSCQNASSACAILANSSIDIVLLDIHVPGLDGLCLVDYISSKHPHIELIAMSSNKELQYIYKSIHPALSGFVLKPIVLDELVHTFAQLFTKDSISDLSSKEAAGKSQLSIPTKQISVQAKEYINNNISAKGLNLKITAEALHVGYHYLSKRFTEQEGITFIEYITTRRLDIACQLLTTTSLHNYEICEQIGLEPKNFHRLFRNKYQMSPQKYRALYATR